MDNLLLNFRYLICFIILAVLMLGGCVSTTKVHVFARYLSDQQVNQIKQAFAQQDFELLTNDLLFPTGMEQSSIVYSPLIKRIEDVDHLAQIFNDLGWPIQNLTPLSTGKHRFTKDTVGVYLWPDSETSGTGLSNRPLNTVQLSNLFNSTQCKTEAKIQLNRDNTFQIKLTNTTDSDIPLHGSWQIRSYPIIELRPTKAEWFMYFEVAQHVTQDQVSQIEMITLKPLDTYPLFADCHFQFGLRI